MSLGRFGGAAPHARGSSEGTGSPSAPDLLEEARQQLTPSPEGMPALSPQLAQYLAGFINFLVQGSFESWSGGTSSAPDGWTLSGAGATVARNTTASQIQDGQASVNVTAALNTITRLSQTVTISTTLNLRLRGRPVTFSARVLASAAARVSLEIDDGVVVTTSPLQHTGSGAFETMAVSVTVDSAATQIKCSLLISSGASITVTMDSAKLEEGSQATAFTLHPRDPFVQPRTVIGVGTINTSSTAFVAMTDMSFPNVILDGNQSVIVMMSVEHKNATTAGRQNIFKLRRDTTGLLTIGDTCSTLNNVNGLTLMTVDIKPPAGNYTYDAQWATENGADTASLTARQLSIAIVPTA